MKYKAMKIWFALMMLGSLSGCQLAKEQERTAGQDRFAGFYVTSESLDFSKLEQYNASNPNKKADNLADVSFRLYADEVQFTPASEPQYVFPGIDGIAFFTSVFPATSERDSYIATIVGPEITNAKFSVHAGSESKTNLEGTIFVSPNKNNNIFHMNAVYQTADGRVYLTPGQGLSSSYMEQEGLTMTYHQTAASSQTINEEQASDTTFVQLFITTLLPSKDIVLLQMDVNHTMIAKSAYTPETMPDFITLDANTEYFIIENHKQDVEGNKIIARTIYGKETESIDWFSARENYILVKQTATMNRAKN